MTECCTLVVPPRSVLAKFGGQRVKIKTVLYVAMLGTVDADEKLLKTREKCRSYYQRRKERAAGRAAP